MTRKEFTAAFLLMVLCVFSVGSVARPSGNLQNGAPNSPQNVPQTPVPNMNPNRPPRTPRAQNVPVPLEFQTGIAALNAAKSALEQAGDKWGGHRVRAIHHIDQALTACGQKPVKTGEMKSGSKDVPAALQTGISQLTNATTLFSQSTNAWGGRRDKAVAFMGQAMSELQAAQALESSKPGKATPN